MALAPFPFPSRQPLHRFDNCIGTTHAVTIQPNPDTIRCTSTLSIESMSVRRYSTSYDTGPWVSCSLSLRMSVASRRNLGQKDRLAGRGILPTGTEKKAPTHACAEKVLRSDMHVLFPLTRLSHSSEDEILGRNKIVDSL